MKKQFSNTLMRYVEVIQPLFNITRDAGLINRAAWRAAASCVGVFSALCRPCHGFSGMSIHLLGILGTNATH